TSPGTPGCSRRLSPTRPARCRQAASTSSRPLLPHPGPDGLVAPAWPHPGGRHRVSVLAEGRRAVRRGPLLASPDGKRAILADLVHVVESIAVGVVEPGLDLLARLAAERPLVTDHLDATDPVAVLHQVHVLQQEETAGQPLEPDRALGPAADPPGTDHPVQLPQLLARLDGRRLRGHVAHRGPPVGSAAPGGRLHRYLGAMQPVSTSPADLLKIFWAPYFGPPFLGRRILGRRISRAPGAELPVAGAQPPDWRHAYSGSGGRGRGGGSGARGSGGSRGGDRAAVLAADRGR